MKRGLSCVDGLAVWYLGITAALLVLGWDKGGVYPWMYGLHVGLLVGIIGLAAVPSLSAPLQKVRETYPLLLVSLCYAEVDLFVKLLHAPPGYDALVSAWDAALFGGHPHLFLPQWLSGRLWSELFHLFYLAYYALLVGSFLGVSSRRPGRLPRFSFVVTGMFVSYVGLFVLFPVTGPLGTAGASITTTGWCPQLVAWLYAPLRMNGIATGAFPSSHVGMSVGIACLLRPRRRWVKVALWGLVGGIAVSTVYGQFHYAIDAVAGAVSGGVLYWGWTVCYEFLRRRGDAVRRPRPTVPAQ